MFNISILLIPFFEYFTFQICLDYGLILAFSNVFHVNLYGNITGKKDTLQNPISVTNYHNALAKKSTQD